MTTNTDTTAASGAASLGPIQRFNLRAGIVNPEANGLYVRYVDHVAHIEAARAAAAPAAQEDKPATSRWVNADDVDRLVRQIDVALYGSAAAEQAQLCDLAALVTRSAAKAGRPLLAPRPQADAGAVPEGCTPADAQILRKANHDLAAESFELQAVLRGIADQAGKALARFDIAPQADAGAVPGACGDDDHVLVPRHLIGSACAAMARKLDAPKTIAELRRYTTGDLSAAAPQAPAAPNMESAALVSARHLLAADPAAHTGTVIKMIDAMLGQAPAAPTNHVAAFWASVEDGTVFDDISPETWHLVDKLAEQLKAAGDTAFFDGAPAPAAGAQDMESVLIDGVAYQTPAPVAAELLRLHLEAMEAPAAGAAPSQHITQPYTVAEIRERVASGDYSAELMLQHALLHLGAGAGAAPTDAMVEAYLLAQRRAVEEADRFGCPNIGGLHTDTVREACRTGLAAALGAAAPAQEAEDGWMPIETAPEGERVLLGPRHAPVVGTVHRPEHWHEEQEPTATVVHYNGTTLVAGYRCSEWRRLPGVARARQEGGGA